jgi:hypothetical protein
MKYFLPFIVMLALLTGPIILSGQPFTIKGRVVDTLNSKELHQSTITVLRAADSVLEAFTRTKVDGSFQVNTTKTGKYIIMITFPGFADYLDIITLDAQKTVVDMGTIPMVSRSHLLTEFVLKQQVGAIKIKGDTVEYMADSFKVRENATVEELLKKLPGIQVNKNGEVVAQGEKVQKILVDGEEFFTDDPAVVTKSLQAKTVEKVQVFDKKSDQAEFTGIDDGTREKTINLHLKDNMKKGYFGKLNAGGGTDGFFENQAMINAFKAKRKIAAFGIVANTGKVGLGWEDRDKYGASGSNLVDMGDGEMAYITGGSDEDESWNGRYNGQGIPAAYTGGLHYSNKWNEDRLHLSNNYRYARQTIESVGNATTLYNDTSSQYYTSDTSTSFSTGERHRVDGMLEWKFDSTSSVKLAANAGYSNNIKETDFRTTSRDSADRVFNSNIRKLSSDITTRHVNANLALRKKFKKNGRTLAITLDEKYRENTGESFLNSSTNISDIIDTTIFINQRKESDSRNFTLTGSAAYTEPISKVLFVEVNYGLTVNNSYADRMSFNPDSNGHYHVVDSLFSSQYDFNVLTNAGGSSLRLVLKKFNFSIGGSVAGTSFRQIDNLTSREFTRYYTNLFPKFSFVYRPAAQKTFSINYNGSTQQPTIDQIQPLRQNTDPLNVSLGNEDLRQKFTHRINIRFNDYKVLSGTYTYFGGGISFVDDDISRSETIDTNRIRFYKYINVDGNYNGYWYGGYGRELRKLDMRVGLNGNINVNRYNSYVNDSLNHTNNNSFSLSLNASYNKEKKAELSFRPGITYNTSTSSVNNSATNYFSYNVGLEGNVQLPHKFEIGTEVDWDIREPLPGFNGRNFVFLWHAYISKKFLKGDNLELRAYANDILDQNIGFQRYGTGNTVYQQSYNTIARYGMLSVIWNFTKSPAMAPASESQIQITK